MDQIITVKKMLPLDSILEGDSAKILKTIPDNCIDLVVTSPPFGKLRENKEYKAIFDFNTIAKELTRIIKPGGVIVWNTGDESINGSESGVPLEQALYFRNVCDLRLHDTMIFAKNSFAFPGVGRYHNIWEYCFIFSKGVPRVFNPLKDRKNITKVKGGPSGRDKKGKRKTYKAKKENTEYGMRFNIWTYKIGGGITCTDEYGHKHPALMHEELAADMIQSWSNKKDIVLDPFAGGGTTLKMAKKLKRHYIGIEISKQYIDDIIIPRLNTV